MNDAKYYHLNNYLKGFTLIDLMVSLLIGTILLGGIAQLLGISRQTFQQIYGISDLFTNGSEAIQYLRMNVKNAGAGMVFPTQAPDPSSQLQPANCPGYCGGGSRSSGVVGVGPMAAIPGWAFLGYYYDCGLPSGSNKWRLGAKNQFDSLSPNFIATGGTSPTNCTTSAQNYNHNPAKPDNGIYYASVECNNQCIISNPGYDQSELINRIVNSPINDLYNPCNGSNKCFGAGHCGYAQRCTLDQGHNCGGICRMSAYQRIIPHIQVTTNPNGKGDILAVTSAIRSGDNNIRDCAGNLINPSNPFNGTATTLPVLVQNTFQVSSNNTLQCQSIVQNNGTWGNPTPWTDIITNVETFRVMVGVNDNLSASIKYLGVWTAVNNVNRYVPTPFPTHSNINGVTASILDVNKILSIRLALVVRSSQTLLPAPRSTNFNLFPATTVAPLSAVNYVSPNDKYQRQLFTTTVFLESLTPAPYVPHCVKGSSQFYIKLQGIPWINGAASTDKCAANASGTCYYYPNFNACEANRYSQNTGYVGAAN